MRITTGKVGTPPKPRTRESPFRAAPAASPANRKIEATRAHTCHYVGVQGEVTSCDGSTEGWAVQQQGQHGERLKAAAQERRTCTVSTMIEKRKKPQQGHQHVRDSSPRRTTNCQPVSRSPVWLAAHAAQMPQLTIEADSVAKHDALHACRENEGGGSDGSRKSCCCGSSAECGSPWPHNCQRRRSDLGEGEGGDEGGEAMVGRGHGRGQHASRASGLNGQGGKLEGARGEKDCAFV